jgi:hypothetical protein
LPSIQGLALPRFRTLTAQPGVRQVQSPVTVRAAYSILATVSACSSRAGAGWLWAATFGAGERGPAMPDRPSGFNPLLVHQVHPGKLAADITASVVSSTLLWRGQLACGLVVHYLVPPLGSGLVLAHADLARLAGTRRGRYVSEHMPASMQALRLTGDLVMTVGAARRQPTLVGLGLVIVLAGWSHPLLGRVARPFATRHRSSVARGLRIS